MTMFYKEELISLETGILAKEKGYDQNPYKTPNAYGPTYTNGSDVKLRSSSLFNPDTNTCVAPTQSLLQKWLREEHNLHITVSHSALDKVFKAEIKYINRPFKRTTGHYYTGKTYEETLEVGLQEGLKLL